MEPPFPLPPLFTPLLIFLPHHPVAAYLQSYSQWNWWMSWCYGIMHNRGDATAFSEFRLMLPPSYAKCLKTAMDGLFWHLFFGYLPPNHYHLHPPLRTSHHCHNEDDRGPPPHIPAFWSSAGELGKVLMATTSWPPCLPLPDRCIIFVPLDVHS